MAIFSDSFCTEGLRQREMRRRDAAVIHVGAETTVMDKDGKQFQMLNQNVLIEIGAAMGPLWAKVPTTCGEGCRVALKPAGAIRGRTRKPPTLLLFVGKNMHGFLSYPLRGVAEATRTLGIGGG
jgi:hypothetical protein